MPTTIDQPRVEFEIRTPTCPTCGCSLARLGVRCENAARGRYEGLEELDEQLHDWALKALYDLAGSIARDDGRSSTRIATCSGESEPPCPAAAHSGHG